MKVLNNIIYTCVTGDYDTLKEPNVITEGWDYICFTNNLNLKSKNWKIIYIENNGLCNTKLARKVKINPWIYLENYDLLFWIDANLNINCDLNKFINNNFNKDSLICMMTHGRRNCIYKEAEQCILENKDNKDVILNQINQYKIEGFPENFGMSQTGLLIRRNTIEVNNFCKLWWNEVLNKSKRDQLSFYYIMWKNPIQYNLFSYDVLFDTFRSNEHNNN